ncbi:hypothetical protein C8F01DRAFT_1094908 [Mycena amicta]|nr:hypothetical protein C8F01DRAFT_1094908 [Mycena amicta]
MCSRLAFAPSDVDSDSDSDSPSSTPPTSSPAVASKPAPTSLESGFWVLKSHTSTLAIRGKMDTCIRRYRHPRVWQLVVSFSARHAEGTPIYSVSVATARRILDYDLIDDVCSVTASGAFYNYPWNHPFWKLSQPHLLLYPYDNHLYPGIAQRAYDAAAGMFLEYGRTIRSSIPPSGCETYFSPLGYNEHRDETGHCTNDPACVLIPECAQEVPTNF